MAQRPPVDLGALEGRIAFWSAGNKPTQDLFGLSATTAALHLRLLYLLSDHVVGSASFFLESSVTRSVVREHKAFTDTGELLFFIDEGVADFREHGREKMTKSPRGLKAYSDREAVLGRATELGTASLALKRRHVSISDAIADLWIADLLSSESGAIGASLRASIHTADEPQQWWNSFRT